jgi:hypothetical protein
MHSRFGGSPPPPPRPPPRRAASRYSRTGRRPAPSGAFGGTTPESPPQTRSAKGNAATRGSTPIFWVFLAHRPPVAKSPKGGLCLLLLHLHRLPLPLCLAASASGAASASASASCIDESRYAPRVCCNAVCCLETPWAQWAWAAAVAGHRTSKSKN